MPAASRARTLMATADPPGPATTWAAMSRRPLILRSWRGARCDFFRADELVISAQPNGPGGCQHLRVRRTIWRRRRVLNNYYLHPETSIFDGIKKSESFAFKGGLIQSFAVTHRSFPSSCNLTGLVYCYCRFRDITMVASHCGRLG